MSHWQTTGSLKHLAGVPARADVAAARRIGRSIKPGSASPRVVSFGDVYIALFLSGPGMTTLPIEIFSYIQWESSPVIAAITTVQIVLIIVFGLAVERLVGLRTAMRL